MIAANSRSAGLWPPLPACYAKFLFTLQQALTLPFVLAKLVNRLLHKLQRSKSLRIAWVTLLCPSLHTLRELRAIAHHPSGRRPDES